MRNSSEVSFDSSEVLFDSSEVLFRSSLENFHLLPGDFLFSQEELKSAHLTQGDFVGLPDLRSLRGKALLSLRERSFCLKTALRARLVGDFHSK